MKTFLFFCSLMTCSFLTFSCEGNKEVVDTVETYTKSELITIGQSEAYQAYRKATNDKLDAARRTDLPALQKKFELSDIKDISSLTEKEIRDVFEEIEGATDYILYSRKARESYQQLENDFPRWSDLNQDELKTVLQSYQNNK